MSPPADLKASKNCRLCQGKIEGHLFGDFTCRSCQGECRRVEPLYRDYATLFVELRREQQFAIKQLKEELADLKNSLSGRQQKASTTLKGLKDDITSLKNEMEAIRKITSQPSGAGKEGKERLKKMEEELHSVKESVKDLDQEVAGVYAAQQCATSEDSEEASAEREEMREAVEGLEDFTRRLKDAFVSLAGPEEKVLKKVKEEEEKDRKEMKEALGELKGSMRQMQVAFALLPGPVKQEQEPDVNGHPNGPPNGVKTEDYRKWCTQSSAYKEPQKADNK